LASWHAQDILKHEAISHAAHAYFRQNAKALWSVELGSHLAYSAMNRNVCNYNLAE